MRTEIQNCIDALEEKSAKCLAFYGAGEVAEIAYVCLHGLSLELVGVVDVQRPGSTFFGYPVQKLTTLHVLDFDAIFIPSLENAAQMRQNLLSLGIPPDKIVCLGEETS